MIVETRAFARIGLLGNPSDGYFGKTISCAISNFSASVTLWESPRLQIVPNAIHDPVEFQSLDGLVATAKRDGYYGGIRLLLATAKKFSDFCHKQGISLPSRNFTLTYDTNIPRQVGLGGSSAIITAAFKALMQFYDLTEDHIPQPVQPNVVLSVETDELDIAAGLQDRVIQVYGGTVYMDFARERMERHGYGLYEHIDSQLLPPLFLAFIDEGSESGKVHSNLRYRYQAGEPQVLDAVREWANIAEQGRTALLERDYVTLHELMNRNFDLRRSVLGDEVIGSANLEMVKIARDRDLPAKFSGSGGAIVGFCEDRSALANLGQEYQQMGYRFAAVSLDPIESEGTR